ncbi:MAG: sulfatase-like hydrolase/transferase [SAR202 cluster bacterium]|nr:sulfatase-like hydrolase/transferase [SAR202 cluster bacterium]
MASRVRPTVVFIMADQLKWSALRMYSEIGIETPSLERLAGEGVMFRNAITPHPLCVPARTSVMTGRYPHSTGCRRNETLMPEDELHAFRVWKEAGYATGLIGKNHCFDQQSDLDLFDVRCELSHRGLPAGGYAGENVGNISMEWMTPEETINASHATRRNMPRQSPTISYAISDHELDGYGTAAITTQVEAFLERAAGDLFDGAEPDSSVAPRPFALWVSYPDPHEPYEAPRRYADMFPPDDVVMPPVRDDEFSGGSAPERNRVLHRLLSQESDTEHDRRAAAATYHAMVRFLDDGVGRVLDALDRLGLRDDTIVVFTADHGDFVGEHGMGVKGGVFYDCLVRVPLIVSWPAGGVPSGIVDESMVNTVDILPTLLQLQGIADFVSPQIQPPEGRLPSAGPTVADNLAGDVLNSESLRRIQGQPLPTVTIAESRKAAFSEYGAAGRPYTMEMLDRHTPPFGYRTLIDTLWVREAEGRRKMVRTVDWKYVTDPMAEPLGARTESGAHPEDELYDLRADPWELRNVAHEPQNSPVVSEMRAFLADWMIRTEDARPAPLPRTIGRS